ncbi:ankyrin repeat domain-containing protein SOWAHB isoform X4 [Octopus sinensis]|uniref:Ankyrin repeat domain-containing protein SOWAHB isoform X4 n=1 Tax=Octopus sinensis TaxID=2607531 RepID=A0A6P7SC41_9MOLL|nr:ankyrin repeat domain-containing protein SOWAHB isoform X4 [Octopus sinensis]
MAVSELSLESVLNFMIETGGKCTNKELVTGFKQFLEDPTNKVKNREKFKEFVNTLSHVKDDKSGNKYLVLKKQYRSNKLLGNKISHFEPQSPPATHASAPTSHEGEKTDNAVRQSKRAKSEPPNMQLSAGIQINIQEPQSETDETISKSQSENNLQNSKSPNLGQSSNTASTSSVASTASEKDTSDGAPSGIRSVKDQAKHLNKLQSESDLQKLTSRKHDKSKSDKNKDGADDDDANSAGGFVTLSDEQKVWMKQSANCDYQELSKLLSKNPSLAKERSFINGYTALHWAAKHGKPDVVKLLCGKPGVNVDQKTFAGFTPLHLASIQCHDDVIELLIQTYKANPNIRDHSGKKPKQYLSSSASARCQQLLQTRSVKTFDENFERTEAIRKSKRVAVVGSLINSSNSMKAQPIMRSSWGGSCEDLYLLSGNLSSHSTSPSSSQEGSPTSGRKNLGASSLMPPPIAPVRKKKQRSKTMYSSKENLDMDFANIRLQRKGSNASLNSSSFV